MSGLPISGVTVDLIRGHIRASTTTNGSGFYSMQVPTYGSEQTVVASMARYLFQAVGALIDDRGETVVVDFSLVTGGDTISGTVTDSVTTNPISGALVEVLSGETVIDTDTTDGSGNYLINNLAPGSYNVQASADNYENEIVGATVITNDEITVDFALDPDPGTISGTVADSVTTNPIAGATVQILQGATPITSALTDGSGNYTISGLAPGSYTVSVSATNFQGQSQGVIVTSNATSTENFALVPNPGTISGTVIGSVTSNPVVGATVQILQGATPITSTLTDGSGNYTVSGLAPGSYTVTVSATNFQGQSQGAIVTSNMTSTDDFALNPNPGTIAGTIINTMTTNPIPGATVQVFSGATVIGTDITDVNGEYSIPGLAPGSYTVQASKTDFQNGIVGASVTSDQTTTVDVALVPDPGTIAGTVMNSSTNGPIFGATVQVLQGATSIASALTDSNGNYVVSGLTSGNYNVGALSINFRNKIVGASTASNAITTVSFVLDPDPGMISGIVTDSATTNPISGAVVKVFRGPILIFSTLTDPNGHYVIFGLTPDSYTVQASATNYQNTSAGANVTEKMTTTVNFALDSDPGAVAGTITNSLTDSLTSTPISGALVEIFQGTQLIASAYTDASGNYVIPNLASGTYNVVVQATSFQITYVSSGVDSDITTIVDLSLQQGSGTIATIVTGAHTGDSLPGVTLTVFDGLDVIAFGLTNSNGEHNFLNIPSGIFTVTAEDINFVTKSLSADVSLNTVTLVHFNLIPKVFPPAGISGKIIQNQYLTQTDYIHFIQWEESPGPSMKEYRVYRNGVLVDTVAFNAPLEFFDHQRWDKTDEYSVVAVNQFGEVSSPVTITLH